MAAAELEPEDIAYPVRSVFRKRRNVQFIMADVKRVDFAAQVVEADGQMLPYDFQVLATGSSAHFFGVPGAATHAFPLRTLEEGVALRNQILSCFERAAQEPDVERRRRLLTFVVVGGRAHGRGVRGCPLRAGPGPAQAGLPDAEYGRGAHRASGIGGERALQPAGASAQEGSRGVPPLGGGPGHGRGRGAQGRLSGADRDGGLDGRGAWRTAAQGLGATDHAQWTSDRAAHPPGSRTSHVYVVGDLAYVEAEERPLPMVAPIAIQQGVAAAKNILLQISAGVPVPFRYRDLGTMAVIGRNAAVVHLFGRWAFTGFPAWVTWLGVHLFKLIGFRNRLLVLTSWVWDYLFYERVVRLILPRRGAALARATRRAAGGRSKAKAGE